MKQTHITPIQARRLMAAGRFGILAVLMAAVIIMQEYYDRKQTARLAGFEARIFERLDSDAGALAERERLIAGDIKSALGQQIVNAEAGIGQLIAEGTAATGGRIAGTNSRVAKIDAVYSGLLAEQKKRTVESLYAETELADKEREAGRLYRSGRYAAAYGLYTVVAEARPENAEARFYQLYSLFLSNKLDRGNYGRIRAGMLALERNGYQRVEMGGVLEYIAAEEAGLGGGVE